MREDLARIVNESGRIGAGGGSARRARSTLVVVQIAASAALLVAAGLLTKNFYQLQRQGPGFVTENVWTGRITLPEARYADDASRARFYEQALEALRALPGVNEVGFTSDLPFSGTNQASTINVDGHTPEPGAPPPTAQLRSISEGYFASLRVPILQGRNFIAGETERVAIVDEHLARTYWPNEGALGQRVGTDRGWHTVVGVVPGIKHESLDEDTSRGTIYWPHEQRPEAAGAFVLRTTLAPEQLTQAARDAILAIDPRLALHDVMAMEALVQQSLGPQRAPLVLTLVFGAGALVLAVIGIYAVLTWAVTQRFGEIGMRMALGAQGRDVVRMVLRQGAKLTIIGLAFGALGALALGRLLQSQVRDVGAADPAVFGIALSGLAAAALLASWIPARRASRIDPMQALRQE